MDPSANLIFGAVVDPSISGQVSLLFQDFILKFATICFAHLSDIFANNVSLLTEIG